MSATKFNTKNDTYRKLMGNGLTYKIPPFQRDYSWTETEWEDLWIDILETIDPDGEPAHYMGYLVLQSNDDKTFDVIDGQQRLTTISLIILTTLKSLQKLIDDQVEPERNKQRLDQLRQTYIGYLDPVTLTTRSKLSLNRNNDHYYQTYLVPLVQTLPNRGFRASEHLLRKAFTWFEKKIEEYIRRNPEPDKGKALAQFIDRLSDSLFFTVITVTDELNAYRVFETLNARGVRLSSTDLLKNYLFSVLSKAAEHDQELRILEDRWEKIVGRLGSESFPEFLRVHWNSRHSFVRQSELFKRIRKAVTEREQVFNLLRQIDEDIDVYLGLTQPETSEWSESCQNSALRLKLFGVRQPFALLISAYRCLSMPDFEKLLQVCVVLSFRYNVIGSQTPSEQEQIYNKAAENLASGEYHNLSQVLTTLQTIYPTDAEFSSAFTNKVIAPNRNRNKRLIMYILCQIEGRLSNTELDFDSKRFNLEHILPQNPQEGWEQFNDEQAEALVNRLGNMTLCEAGLNRDIGNREYEYKRSKYEESGFALTKRIAEHYDQWTADRVIKQQKWLAQQAVTIWKVSQFLI
jgi:Protein of unknown function DUF262/Protein of unknown function (DUF1524)